MPWTCPACQLQIRHSDLEPLPRPGAVYRCHVCRLELVVDRTTQKLTAAPIATANNDPRERP
jgi:hypothetical protein